MAEATFLGIDIVVLLIFVLVVMGTVLLARGAYTLSRRALDLRLGKRRSKVLSNLLQYVVLAFGLGYGVLDVLKLDLTALAASLGLVGIAIAFSSQQLIQNMVAGAMIALDRRVQIEDWIEITNDPLNRPSRIVDITLTRTVLRDVNGRMTIVPNSVLITNRVVNYTQSGFVEVVIPFPLPISADRRFVMEAVQKVVEEHPLILPNVQGAELAATERELRLPQVRSFLGNRTKLDQFRPRVMVQEVTNIRVMLSVRFWIREVQHRDLIVSEVLSAALDRLKEAGIDAP